MNILILNWRDTKNPKSGGAEIVTLEHAKAWVKAGHKVTWFTSKFTNCKNQEVVDGVNIIRKGTYLTVFLHAPLFYLFSKEKYDVIIDEIHGIPFFTPVFARIPKVAFIHEVADEIWDYMFPFPVGKFGKFIQPIYFKLYSNVKFWTDADSTIDDLQRNGIKRKNCVAINCPAENKTVSTLPNKEKEPTFIFVSRVVKMKGIEEVTRAFFYILREIKNAHLWIVGDGESSYVEELRETMRQYSISPKVKFWGRVSNEKKLELMRKSHILLHASVKEGWGLVVIEAASQGTPSVVYNVSGLRDSVKNGTTGIVVSENNAKELATEAMALLKDKKKYETFQKNCLTWTNSLTWPKATQKSLALLEEVTRKS